MYTITKTFGFEASHRLAYVNKSDEENSKIFSKCANLPSHGHSYKVKLFLKSNKLENGMVMNFLDVKKIFNERIYNYLDHQFLNDKIKGLTAAEKIAEWIYDDLEEHMPLLREAEVWETETSSASYTPPKYEGGY